MNACLKLIFFCGLFLILVGIFTKDLQIPSSIYIKQYVNTISKTKSLSSPYIPEYSLSGRIFKILPYIDDGKLSNRILKKNHKNISASFTKLYNLMAEYVFQNKSKTHYEIDQEMNYEILQDFTNKSLWEDYLYGFKHEEIKRKFYTAIYNGMEHFFQTCEKLNLTCFPVAGSLLGSWRHHSIIPWDYDADVMVGIQNNSLAETRTLIMKHLKYEPTYLTSFLEKDWCRLFWTKFHGFETGGTGSGQIDIWFYRENETHIICDHRYAKIKYPKTWVFPLHKRPFGLLSVPCPRNTFACLKASFPDTVSKKDCGSKGKCLKLKDKMAFVFRVPFLQYLLEVTIRNTTVLNVAITNEPNITDVQPFVIS